MRRRGINDEAIGQVRIRRRSRSNRSSISGRGVGEDDNRKGDDYDGSNDPALETSVALSESDPEMTFGFGGKEATSIYAGYGELVFSVFARGYTTPAKKNTCGLRLR